MQKVLIIEDDHFSARRLKRLIMDIDDTIDVHGPLKSMSEVTEELAANNDYDLIFSDIRLADGDVFEAFRKVMPQSFVIFTTAYDEYAMEAIKNNRIYTNLTNDQSIESYGIGISNLKQRYRLEGEAEPEFIAHKDSFEVRLPIIKRKQ